MNDQKKKKKKQKKGVQANPIRQDRRNSKKEKTPDGALGGSLVTDSKKRKGGRKDSQSPSTGRA